MKKDPLLWAALGAVLVVLASAEYELARACGFGKYVAAGVPAALDIYAVKALRAKRDVAAAVVSLILVNAASHLVSSGIIPAGWPLVVAVSAIAPLVLWRVHRLSEEGSGPVPTPPVPAPASTPEYTPGYVPAARVHPLYSPPVGPHLKAPKSWPPTTQVEGASRAPELEGSGGSGLNGYTRDTPPGYVPAPVPEAEVHVPGDGLDELTELARKEFADLLEDGRTPSIRQLRGTYSIGQPRAERIQRELGRSDDDDDDDDGSSP